MLHYSAIDVDQLCEQSIMPRLGDIIISGDVACVGGHATDYYEHINPAWIKH